MSAKSDRQAAREAVAAYHEIQMAALVERVGSAIDRFRGGHLDAFAADQVPFQYPRAAKELWNICNPGDTEVAANIVRERPEDRLVGARAPEALTTSALMAQPVNSERTGDVDPQPLAGEGKFNPCRRISCTLKYVAQPAATIIETPKTARGTPLPNQEKTPSRTSNSGRASQRALFRRSASLLGGTTKNRDSGLGVGNLEGAGTVEQPLGEQFT